MLERVPVTRALDIEIPTCMSSYPVRTSSRLRERSLDADLRNGGHGAVQQDQLASEGRIELDACTRTSITTSLASVFYEL